MGWFVNILYTGQCPPQCVYICIYIYIYICGFEGPVRGPVRRSVTPVVADADADGFTVVKRKRTVTKPKAVIGTKLATTKTVYLLIGQLVVYVTDVPIVEIVKEGHTLSWLLNRSSF